jgi:diguanylate cyclase (GGDEF)-like protein/PAS domain S-box-containing protein
MKSKLGSHGTPGRPAEEPTRADTPGAEARSARAEAYGEAQYQRLFESAPHGILVLDAETGAILDANVYLIRMLGYTRPQLVGKKFWEVEAFTDIGASQAALDAWQADEYIRREGLPLRASDGHVIEVEFVSSLCEVSHRKVVQCHFRDLAGWMLTDETLPPAEAELRALFASMSDVVLVIDRLGVYRKIAPTKPGLLNKPPHEMLGKGLRDVFPPEQADAFLRTVKQVLKTGRTAGIEYELPLGRRRVWFSASISRMDADNTLWVARDVTRSKQAEHQLAERAKELGVLYGLAKLIERDGITLDDLYQESANMLPTGWQHPETTYARIVVGDREFRTENFAQSPWKQSAPLIVNGMSIGNVEVGYLEQRPQQAEGPFLKEERDLIDAMAGRLARVTERMQAEAALRVAEANYSALHENATVGIYRSTPQGRFLSVNPAMARIFGYDSPDQMIQSISSVAQQCYVDPAARREFQRLITEHGHVREFASWVRRKDGEAIWVQEDSRVVMDEHGEAAYYEGFIADITRRKLAEETLRQAEAKYRDIFDNASEGIFQSTPAGKFSTANPALARMLGYGSPEELIAAANDLGREFYVQPGRREEFIGLLNDHGMISGLESQVYRKDGGQIWVSENARVVRDEEGSARYEGTLVDITKRRQAEEALRESEARYRVLTQSANDAIVSIDEAGLIMGWNRGAETIFGYSASEANGQPVALIMPSRFRDLHAAGLERLRAGGEPHVLGRTVELEGRRKDGSEFPLELSLSDWRVADARFYTAICRDTTERTEMTAELRRAQEALEAANHELQQLLAREEVLARRDALTGLPNRLDFDERAAREFQIAVRHQRPLAAMMFDVDDFKQVNDTLGHAAGDSALALVAHTLSADTRASDVVARLGGDEFVVLLPETTTKQALPIAERIRARAAKIRLGPSSGPPGITLSIGIAELQCQPTDATIEQIFQRADLALYRAKASGGNCVCVDGA